MYHFKSWKLRAVPQPRTCDQTESVISEEFFGARCSGSCLYSLTTQELDIGRIKACLGKKFERPYLNQK
jgi:hypothetical protein